MPSDFSSLETWKLYNWSQTISKYIIYSKWILTAYSLSGWLFGLHIAVECVWGRLRLGKNVGSLFDIVV